MYFIDILLMTDQDKVFRLLVVFELKLLMLYLNMLVFMFSIDLILSKKCEFGLSSFYLRVMLSKL